MKTENMNATCQKGESTAAKWLSGVGRQEPRCMDVITFRGTNQGVNGGNFMSNSEIHMLLTRLLGWLNQRAYNGMDKYFNWENIEFLL
jgi:hypothetical protein